MRLCFLICKEICVSFKWDSESLSEYVVSRGWRFLCSFYLDLIVFVGHSLARRSHPARDLADVADAPSEKVKIRSEAEVQPGLEFPSGYMPTICALTPEVAQDYVASPVIASDAEGKILTASVPDDRLEDFFGIELPGVTGMTIAVAYTASAIRSLTLAYTQNAASVTVTVTYTY